MSRGSGGPLFPSAKSPGGGAPKAAASLPEPLPWSPKALEKELPYSSKSTKLVAVASQDRSLDHSLKQNQSKQHGFGARPLLLLDWWDATFRLFKPYSSRK